MAIAQNVSGGVNFNLNFQQVAAQGLGVVNSTGIPANEVISQTLQYVNGISMAYGVDQLYAGQFSLASTTKTWHFQTATSNDPFGNSLAMLRIRELIIQNVTLTSGFDLKVEASASNGISWLPLAASKLLCYAGGILRFSDPLSLTTAGQVVGATTDGLTVDSGSNTVVFNIIVLGCATA